MSETAGSGKTDLCPACGKPAGLCVCDAAEPVDNRLFVLILQHPQEKAEALGTAPLLMAVLKHARLVVGLSWPNLARALGHDADPHRWGVLYLGTGAAVADRRGRPAPVVVVDRKGRPLDHQEAVMHELEGIIALDGSWSQAKALWWRNPWLLKCRRLMLNPPFASRYGVLRREPRRESLSTLEAVALALSELEDDEAILERLMKPFEALLERYRAQAPAKTRRRRN